MKGAWKFDTKHIRNGELIEMLKPFTETKIYYT